MGIIERLKDKQFALAKLSEILDNLYQNGPISDADVEQLTYINIFYPDFVECRLDDILLSFGLFYKKQLHAEDLHSVVLEWYKDVIYDKTQAVFTPLQADVLLHYQNRKYISLSAPTSTGKSFIFNEILRRSQGDVVIVVPNRALINEYYLGLQKLFQDDKSVNILTFIDHINIRVCRRSVFVVTPERCNELFLNRNYFNIEAFLFDEAQLSDDQTERALYFDSIVRKALRYFSNAKLLFAQPFVNNPDAQFKKHQMDELQGYAKSYKLQSVGRVFVSVNKNQFSFFSIKPESPRERSVFCDDPLDMVLKAGGTVLVFVSKNSIVRKSFLNEYSKYIDMCEEMDSPEISKFLERMKEYTGGDTIADRNYYSLMIALMRRGIVVHHGSMPLEVRSIMEEFIKAKLCRLCFATQTLEQGINMPFDVVYITTFRNVSDLDQKNLIGRAGRSTDEHKFDYGYVVVPQSHKNDIRKVYGYSQKMNEKSCIDQQDVDGKFEYNKIKTSLSNDTYSDEYNMPNEDVERLSQEDITELLRQMLDMFFVNGELCTDFNQLELRPILKNVYRIHLNRELNWIEENTLNTALQIFVWKLHGKTFKNICQARYAYLSRAKERRDAIARGHSTDGIKAVKMYVYSKFPYKDARHLDYLTDTNQKASDVDYDMVVSDTYDFLDKLIGMNFGNVLYTAFKKLFEMSGDVRAKQMANYIKYGTDDEKSIMLMRYGMSFEIIEKILPCVEYAGEDCIKVTPSFYNLDDDVKKHLTRYL